jgi:hypothetical protein
LGANVKVIPSIFDDFGHSRSRFPLSIARELGRRDRPSRANKFKLRHYPTLDGPTMMARIGIMRALNRNVERTFNSSRKGHALGTAKAKEGPMTTVWIYVDTSKDVGDPDHLKVFATPEAADEWFKEHDPEGVVFGYEVLE